MATSDFARAVEVWEASVRATHSFVTDADIEEFRPMVVAALPTMDNLRCIRDTNGTLAGFVAVVEHKVEMLFIHPSHRGKGGGRQLLEYAVHEFGATELDVNEQNPLATQFYERMGFEVVGRSELDSSGKAYPLLHMRLKHS